MSYEVVNNIIFFDSDFNKILDNKIIQVIKFCDIIYFNNYDNIKTCIKIKNKCFNIIILEKVLNLSNQKIIYQIQ